MNTNAANEIIASISETIDIPDSAYEKAIARAKDLESWVQSGSESAQFDPEISVQGSFRLGTVNRPLKEDDEYDLDLSWLLRNGYSKGQHSQADFKALVGRDIEAYRRLRRIETAREEKNRCWRLHYKDDLRFHLDGVPCLPELGENLSLAALAMQRQGLSGPLSRLVAEHGVNVTDRTASNYRVISPDWLVSNPEGYARWFESRMRQATALLESRVREARVASIDDLPAYRWKTPVQHCVQLLKRHRDVMFDALPDAKPISIIITTLAARAYRGEADVAAAMTQILLNLDAFVNSSAPRVPNPVNPDEDFADKWATVDGRRLQLEENFERWVAQAKADFAKITTSGDPAFITEQARARFRAPVDTAEIERRLGVGFPRVVVRPRQVLITEPARPWRRN
jgi:hypothetical protein